MEAYVWYSYDAMIERSKQLSIVCLEETKFCEFLWLPREYEHKFEGVRCSEIERHKSLSRDIHVYYERRTDEALWARENS